MLTVSGLSAGQTLGVGIMNYTMLAIWLGILVVFVVLEALTVQLLSIWFSAAALVSLVLALLGVPEYIQIIVFFVCTALLLVLTRPIAKRFMSKPMARTNADRVVGERAVVIQDINNDLAEGQVKVQNQIWTARSISGEEIKADSMVIIHSIEGVKVLVEELKEEKS